MNSMIFLFSLISFVSLCRGQRSVADGTAAVTELVTKLGNADTNSVIKDALTEALDSIIVGERTTLNSAAILIPAVGIKELGATVLAGATLATPAVSQPIAFLFVQSVFVTFYLDKPLVITPKPNQEKALNALATAIGPMDAMQMRVLETGILLLSAVDFKNIGSGVITAAAGADADILKTAVTTYLVNIQSHTTTYNKLVDALKVGLTGDQPTKLTYAITTAYADFPLANKTELQKSTAALEDAQILGAGTDLIAAVKSTADVLSATVTTFFTALNSVGKGQITINTLGSALTEGLKPAEQEKITTAISTTYDKLKPEAQVELQTSTGKLNDEQIKAAGKDMIAAATATARIAIPEETVLAFFTAINAAAATNSSPVTQCSVTLLIASVAGAALYRSIGSL